MSDLEGDLKESIGVLNASWSEGGWHAGCAQCGRIDSTPEKERIVAERWFTDNGWTLGICGDLCNTCFAAMVQKAKEAQ